MSRQFKSDQDKREEGDITNRADREITISRKKQRKKRSFDELPPRVIIHEIISAYLFSVSSEFDDLGEFELFGYFLLDRSRNIWFVFQSLHFESSIKNCGYESIISRTYFSLSKLFSLGIHGTCESLIDKIIEYSPKMYSLRKLEITKWSMGDRKVLFNKKGCFKNLKCLIFRTNCGGNFDSTFHSSGQFFEQLEHLELHPSISIYGDRNPLCFSSSKTFFNQGDNRFKNIRVLTLYYISFVQEMVRVEFPALIRLNIASCKNIIIVPGNRLKSVYLWGYDEKIGEILRRSENLEELDIDFCFENKKMDILDLLHPNCRLSELRIRGINWGDGYVESFKNHSLCSNLSVMSIDQSDFASLPKDIFGMIPFPSLEKLVVKLSGQFVRNLSVFGQRGETRTSCFKWPCSQNLRVLYIGGWLTDQLFRKNDWPVLEYLSITHSRNYTPMTGKEWRPLTSLKRLSISVKKGIFNFSDEFFQKSDHISKLRRLSVIVCKDASLSLKFVGWNKMFYDRIRSLNLRGNRSLKDSFFQQHDFLSLDDLTIKHNPNLGGIGWKNMCMLRNLLLTYYPKIQESQLFTRLSLVSGVDINFF